MDIKIQRYDAQHRDQMVGLFEDFQDYLAGLDPLRRLRRLPGYGEHALSATLDAMTAYEGAFYVARDGERVIGFVAGIIQRLTEADRLGVIPTAHPGRVTELYVDPAYRGQGVGTRLMSTVEAYLKEKGCDVVKVEVFVPTSAARRLYETLGFEPRDIDTIKRL